MIPNVHLMLFLDGTYYTSHTTMLSPEFIGERMAGLNFFAHCALLMDEVNGLNEKMSEKWGKLIFVKAHRDGGAASRQLLTKVLQ